MELTRRGFLKSVGAATLAVAAVGLLGGCEGGEMVGNANGLNDTAELKGIKMTVRSLAYASYSDGTFYLVPEVLINNGSAAGIPLNPTGGSFKLRVNGSEELDINSDTMAILNKNSKLNALDTRTLNRGQYAKGHLCGKGSGVSKFNYVQVLFYPNPQDAKTYLCCKDRSQGSFPDAGHLSARANPSKPELCEPHSSGFFDCVVCTSRAWHFRQLARNCKIRRNDFHTGRAGILQSRKSLCKQFTSIFPARGRSGRRTAVQ